MKIASTTLAFCVGLLLALSMVMLYSAGTLMKDNSRFLVMQLVSTGLGLVVCFVLAFLDYKWLRAAAWPVFILALVLLTLVLVPGIGVKTNGARRWFNLVVMNFQPSEVGKIGLIVILAWYGERFQRQMPTFVRGLALPGLCILPVLLLIFVEPDRGTTILMAAVSLVMLFTAGARLIYFVPPVVLAVAGLAWSLSRDTMRINRILSWLHPEEHKQGVGYQAWQAMVALGNGGWQGLGLGDGRQKLGFVPEHQTDFIFSVIGEELGLVATLGVVVVFIVFVLAGIYISSRARDTFGLLLGTGITFLIGLQAFINIGVVTGVLPNKGLPLPFVSYGGSNLLLMMACAGVLFSIARHAHEEAAEPGTANPFGFSAVSQ